jgi:hypothetical protein
VFNLQNCISTINFKKIIYIFYLLKINLEDIAFVTTILYLSASGTGRIDVEWAGTYLAYLTLRFF